MPVYPMDERLHLNVLSIDIILNIFRELLKSMDEVLRFVILLDLSELGKLVLMIE